MTYDPNPPPLEQTDAELAKQMQLIATGKHPVIHRLQVEKDCIRYMLRDGTVRVKKIKMPGRNDSCYCGSGKKFKKCCLR